VLEFYFGIIATYFWDTNNQREKMETAVNIIGGLLLVVIVFITIGDVLNENFKRKHRTH
jgi:hypothetical protein